MVINKELKSSLYLAIVPILAFVALVFTTRFFIGISPDSIMYVSAAQSFIDTGELRSIFDGLPLQYMTHYPPGLSLFISFFSLFTSNLYDAARLLNAISIFALLFSVGLITRKYLSTSYIISLQALLMLNLSLFSIYQMLWTEPIYIILSIFSLVTLNLFVNTKNIKYLLITSVLLSTSVFVRYIGVSLIITSVIYIWIALKNEKSIERIKYIFILGFISSSSFLYWTIRNYILVANPTDRHFSFHPMTMEYYEEWLTSTTTFFIGLTSNQLGDVLSYIIGAIIIIALLYYSMQVFRKSSLELNYIFILYPTVYLAFLFISNTFFDFTPLYYRTLSPVYIFFTISIFTFIWGNAKLKKILKLSLITIFLLLYGSRFTINLVKYNDGKGLSSKAYMIPNTISELEKLNSETKVYTNEAERLYLLTNGRLAEHLRNIQGASEDEFIIVYFYNGRHFDSGILSQQGYSSELIVKTDDLIIQKYVKHH